MRLIELQNENLPMATREEHALRVQHVKANDIR
jgi:hypothetical protein